MKPAAASLIVSRRRRHREMLVIACLVAVAAPLLRVLPDERVGLDAAPQWVLPPLCLSRDWFGVRCPGCGLTRSFVHLAHGDWRASSQAHRLGWLLAAALAVQIPYRFAELRRCAGPLVPLAARKVFAWSLIVLLVGNWVVETLGWF